MAQKPLKERQIPKTFEDELDEILDEAGISFSDDFNLILHNDNINDMIHVVVALYEICKLSNERSMAVMLEAHNKGKSLITCGEINKVLDMKSGLDQRGLTTSVEVS